MLNARALKECAGRLSQSAWLIDYVYFRPIVSTDRDAMLFV